MRGVGGVLGKLMSFAEELVPVCARPRLIFCWELLTWVRKGEYV